MGAVTVYRQDVATDVDAAGDTVAELRARVQKALELLPDDVATVNGQAVDESYQVKTGDVITFRASEEATRCSQE